jgi:hypothetical protein
MLLRYARGLAVTGFNRRLEYPSDARDCVMQRPRGNITIWRKLKFEHNGKTLIGSYAHNSTDQTVEVKSLTSSKTAQLGGLTPEGLARLMLIELANEGKA